MTQTDRLAADLAQWGGPSPETSPTAAIAVAPKEPSRYVLEAVHGRLAEWRHRYSLEILATPLSDGHPEAEAYEARLWACWQHHWRQAWEAQREVRLGDGVAMLAVGQRVADRLVAGRNPGGSGALGGNPLRDVVLAEGVTRGDEAATRRLLDEYQSLLERQAGKVDAYFAQRPEEWWNEFVDTLAGYTSPPGKLTRFVGRCGLGPWLRVVVSNYLRRRPLPRSSAVAEEAGELPPDAVLVDECRRALEELLSDAIRSLHDLQQRVLLLLFAEGLTSRQAGRLLGIDASNVVRRRDRALASLREDLDRKAGATARDCLGQLPRPDQHEVGGMLVEVLRQASEAEVAS